jgi:hypothetical protein
MKKKSLQLASWITKYALTKPLALCYLLSICLAYGVTAQDVKNGYKTGVFLKTKVEHRKFYCTKISLKQIFFLQLTKKIQKEI